MHPEPVSVPSLIRSAAKAKPGQPLMSMVPLLVNWESTVTPDDDATPPGATVTPRTLPAFSDDGPASTRSTRSLELKTN